MAKKYLQEKLIAGENITIAADGKTISATGGSGGVTKEYVDTAVAGEATRASNKENAIEAKVTVIEDTYATQYQLSQKVDRTVTEDNGSKSIFDNSKGQHGCVMQSDLGDTIVSFNTNDDAGADGILGQIYAKNKTTGSGMRFNIYKDGIYYGKGTSTPKDAAHEIAVKGDITGGGVEALELEVRPVSESKSEGALTAEQFNKLKTGLNPIHLKVYMGGTEYRYYVDINQYWYDNNEDKIGANVILMNYSGDSSIIAKLWAIADTSTEPATYKLELTSDDFEYSKWIKSTEIDGKTIVKNSTTNKYETAIGGYMETGLVPYDPYICYELALNQWATNPKVWFVTEQNYTMQVGDTVTAIILDQDTGNQWTISNATVATYTIDGVDHIGVQYSEPKGGAKELYVLRWDAVEGEERVVVYNNDDKIVLHNGAILTAYKMTEGQVPHVMDGKFLPIDGTTIVYNETENYIHAVSPISRKEFDMLSEEVATKQGDLTEVDGYDASKAQVLEHDKYGKLMWVDKA